MKSLSEIISNAVMIWNWEDAPDEYRNLVQGEDARNHADCLMFLPDGFHEGDSRIELRRQFNIVPESQVFHVDGGMVFVRIHD